MNNNQNNNPLGTFNQMPNVPYNNEPNKDEQIFGMNQTPNVPLNIGVPEQPIIEQNNTMFSPSINDNNQINNNLFNNTMGISNNNQISAEPLNINIGNTTNNQLNNDNNPSNMFNNSMNITNNNPVSVEPLNIIPENTNNNQFNQNNNIDNNFEQNFNSNNLNNIPYNLGNDMNTSFTNNENMLPPIANQINNTNFNDGLKENNEFINSNEENIISVKKYLGHMVLFSLPVVGFIMLIIKGFVEKKDKNISNFAKANLIFSIIVTVVSTLVVIIPFALLYLGSKEIVTNKPDIDVYLPEENTFDGTLYYANSERIDNIFTYKVPEVFEDEGISTSLHYTYGDKSIFGDCVFELNSIEDYDSAEKLIEEMSEYYYETPTKKKINNINWNTFSLYGYDETYYFATDIQDTVYLYKFEINNNDVKNECIAYHESIVNSIKLK